MAASATHAISGAAARASASTNSAANTAASGVRAPASRLGSDRFSEPLETKHEKNGPTRFDRPWPRHSRFTSSGCPLRAASTLAMAIVCPSDTMVSATAMPASRGTSPHCSGTQRQLGQGCGSVPTKASGCCA